MRVFILSTINILVDNNPSDENNAFLRNGIVNFNAQFLNEKASSFSIFAKNPENKIIGGATIGNIVMHYTSTFYGLRMAIENKE